MDLRRAVRAQRAELDDACARVLERGRFVLGAEVEAFEAEFSRWASARHAVGVASGTDALELAVRALDLPPGGEVVTQATTCVPTIAAIERAGLRPVLCDVEPAAGTIDPVSLAAAITPATVAIVPVHLYGQCADMDAVLDVARGLPVVEDCAQAHGATFRGRPAGTMGVAGAFSFYPTKNLGALGDAGAVITGHDELAARVRALRRFGQAAREVHARRGVNSRLDELQAAVLRVRLPLLAAANERRREIAAVYRDALDGASARPLACLPERVHAQHLFVADCEARDDFRAALKAGGVETLVHYPVPLHRQPAYAAVARVPLPCSEALCGRIVSLPLFPELTDGEVARVAAAAAAAAA